MSFIKKTPLLLLVAAIVACDKAQPTEIRTSASTFPALLNWAGTAAPIAPATVTGTLSFKQDNGNRGLMTMTINGAPNASYQWRILRGDCTVNVAQAAAPAGPTGLVVFATSASYPDIVVNAAGVGSSSRIVAGQFDTLRTYSVRIRVLTTATTWNGVGPISCGNLTRSPA